MFENKKEEKSEIATIKRVQGPSGRIYKLPKPYTCDPSKMINKGCENLLLDIILYELGWEDTKE